MMFKIIKKLEDSKHTYIICKKLNNRRFLLLREHDNNFGLMINGSIKYIYDYMADIVEEDIHIIPMTFDEKEKYYEIN